MNRLMMGFAAVATLAGFAPAVTASAQTVNQREYNQQHRIEQGERSGELTRGEANRMEGREYRLARHESNMRYRNGGYLTAHNRTVLRRQENRDSRAIYRTKHNGRVY